MSAKDYTQKSIVENRVKDYWNYVTGSAGGWPNLSRAGIIAGMDFTIESGSDEVKFFESNTNLYTAQVTTAMPEIFTKISNYAASQSFDNVIIYGMTSEDHAFGMNPPESQKPYISSSFAANNISSSFHNADKNPYFTMRGSGSFASTFHLFFDSPGGVDDNLYNIASSSFDKDNFRSVLSASPVSSSLIPLYVSSSKTAGEGVGDWPDYVTKTRSGDASFQITMGGKIFFNTYRADLEPSASQIWDTYNTGNTYVNETFINGSGSVDDSGQKYVTHGRCVSLLTPEETQIVSSFYNSKKSKLYTPNQPSPDPYGKWVLHPYRGPSSPSGSLIRMYDGSTKQVQDVQVGDVVKSYQPLGMPDTDLNFLTYAAYDLSGSFFSGSVVVGTHYEETPHYYTVSGSNGNSYFIHQLGSVFGYDDAHSEYRFIQGFDIDIDDKLFDKDGNEITVVAKTENYGTEVKRFYSLNVEDIDTYFQSDILVHNIPTKE
jgi:hypothetical protein